MAYDPHSAYQPPPRHHHPQGVPQESFAGHRGHQAGHEQYDMSYNGGYGAQAGFANQGHYGNGYAYDDGYQPQYRPQTQPQPPRQPVEHRPQPVQQPRSEPQYDGRNHPQYAQQPQYSAQAVDRRPQQAEPPRPAPQHYDPMRQMRQQQQYRADDRPAIYQGHAQNHASSAMQHQVYQQPEHSHSMPQQARDPRQDLRVDSPRQQKPQVQEQAPIQIQDRPRGHTQDQPQRELPRGKPTTERYLPRDNGHSQQKAPRRPLIEQISPDKIALPIDNAFPTFPTKSAVAKQKVKATDEKSRLSTSDDRKHRSVTSIQTGHASGHALSPALHQDSPPRQDAVRKHFMSHENASAPTIGTRPGSNGPGDHNAGPAMRDFARDQHPVQRPSVELQQGTRQRVSPDRQAHYLDARQNCGRAHGQPMHHPGTHDDMPRRSGAVNEPNGTHASPPYGPNYTEQPVHGNTLSYVAAPVQNGAYATLRPEHEQPPQHSHATHQVPRQGHHAKQSSLSEMYAEYYGDDLAHDQIHGQWKGTADNFDRAAEIEAEMPDFGAPGHASTSMHKRDQTLDVHLNSPPTSAETPPMPSLQANGHYQQNHQHVPDHVDGLRQPQPQQLSGLSGLDGFDFEVPEPIECPPTPSVYSNPASPQQFSRPFGIPEQHRFAQSQSQPQPQSHSPPMQNQSQQRLPMPMGPSAFAPSQQGRPMPPPQQRQAPSNGDRFQAERPLANFPQSRRPPPEAVYQSRPDVNRFTSDHTMRSDPGPMHSTLAPGGNMNSATGPEGISLSKQRSAPQPGMTSAPTSAPQPPTQQQQRISNPDALPAHPAPVRPGLMGQSPSPHNGAASQARPLPVRQYNMPTPQSQQAPSPRTSLDSGRHSQAQPVSQAEINRLQAQVNAHPQDHKTALLLAQKLVEASTVLASENGRLDPRQTAKNREKYIIDAHRRIKKLVTHGYPEAMFYLADCYGQGLLGLEVDTKEAFNLYQAAAKAGHAQAAYRTAVCCEMGPEEGGGARRDIQKAVQWYRRAAQLQDVAAMYKLGVVLLKGLLGQPKNVVEAETWLKRAAERADKDNPHPLHELGLLYETENTDPAVKAKIIPDDQYSRELFMKAAKLGWKLSQFRLGQAYEYGSLGLPIDARSSIAWYSKAAAQGEHGAELALSGWYLTGAEGILEHSDTEAYLWARKAASADPPMPKAMFAMGYYTETGIGCPKSVDEAKKWYGRAAAYKFPKAMERLEELKRGGGVGSGAGGPGGDRRASKDVRGARLQRRDARALGQQGQGSAQKEEADCRLM